MATKTKTTKRSPLVFTELMAHVESEKALLGSCLIDPHHMAILATKVSRDDFWIERHAWLWEAMTTLYARSKGIDNLTLSEHIKTMGKEIDDSYITHLMTDVTPSSLHAEYYAGIVLKYSFLRRLNTAAGDLAKLAHDGISAEDIDEIADQAEQKIFNLTGDSRYNKKGFATLSSSLSSYTDRLEHLSQSGDSLVGLPTGLRELDRSLGGLIDSDMIVMAGRPGMGKTALAVSTMFHLSKRWGKHCGMFSLEMSREQVTQRLIAMETGISVQNLRLGNIQQDEWGLYFKGIDTLSKCPIFIDDTPAISVLELRQKARRLHAEHGLDMLVIDYLQLMTGDKKSENRTQEISYISRSIKALARELNIPIVALSQLSRNVESRGDKRPMLSDLKESGSIEQDADIVLFLYRDVEYHPDTMYPDICEIIMGKFRNGQKRNHSVYFRKHCMQFIDLEIKQRTLAESKPMNGNGSNGHHPKEAQEIFKMEREI